MWNEKQRLRPACVVLTLTALVAGTVALEAADLQQRTVDAFNRYVRVSEARMKADRAFLWVETLPESQRRARLNELRREGLVIERLTTRESGKEIRIPDGLVHHWVGMVFVPKATVAQALKLLQDYDRHTEIYKPAVARSKLLERKGDVFRVYLRFYQKKVLTVVVNSEHEAVFSRPAPDRAQSRIYSTRIAQVEDPDTPRERELPVGRDGGYLWRLYTYWRFLERDGGTYIECESISLTRDIPLGLGFIVGPFVTSVPRESLEFTLTTTRRALAR